MVGQKVLLEDSYRRTHRFANWLLGAWLRHVGYRILGYANWLPGTHGYAYWLLRTCQGVLSVLTPINRRVIRSHSFGVFLVGISTSTLFNILQRTFYCNGPSAMSRLGLLDAYQVYLKLHPSMFRRQKTLELQCQNLCHRVFLDLR